MLISSKTTFTLKLFIAFKMAYSCCFDERGNLDFPDFLQKKFYNINVWFGYSRFDNLYIIKIFTYFFG